jgi:hypothetical protein
MKERILELLKQRSKEMNKQKGYYNMDFTGLIWGGLVVGCLLGIGLWEALKWAWPYIKQFVHQATA